MLTTTAEFRRASYTGKHALGVGSADKPSVVVVACMQLAACGAKPGPHTHTQDDSNLVMGDVHTIKYAPATRHP